MYISDKHKIKKSSSYFNGKAANDWITIKEQGIIPIIWKKYVEYLYDIVADFANRRNNVYMKLRFLPRLIINRLRTCVIRSNCLKRIFLSRVRNWRFNSSSLSFVQDSRRKSCANYAVILRLARRLLPLFNIMRSNFEIRRSLLSLS